MSQDIYNLNSSKKFASYLFQSEQFELAAIEYERLLFLEKGNDSIKFNLINSYYHNKNYDKALTRSLQLFPELKDFTEPLANLYIKLLILNENYDTFENQFTRVPLSDKEKNVYQLHKNILNREFRKAYGTYNKLADFPFKYKEQFNEILQRSKHPDTKSPFLAGALSALIPGAGKFYTGNWKDGIFSFLVVGGSAFQAYRGFSKDGTQSTTGWIFGTVATGFYFGNIYGSVKSAQVYNENYWIEIENEAKELIHNSY